MWSGRQSRTSLNSDLRRRAGFHMLQSSNTDMIFNPACSKTPHQPFQISQKPSPCSIKLYKVRSVPFTCPFAKCS